MSFALNYAGVSITPIRHDDIEFLRVVRNNPEVRRYLITDEEISAEQQKRWYAAYHSDPAQVRFLVKEGDVPAGITSITDIIDDGTRRGEQGIVLAQDFWNRGIGTKARVLLHRYAFRLAAFKLLVGEVHDDNISSHMVNSRTGSIRISREKFEELGFKPAQGKFIFYLNEQVHELENVVLTSSYDFCDLKSFPKP